MIFFEIRFPGIFVLKYKDTCCIKTITLLLKTCLPLSQSISFLKNPQHNNNGIFLLFFIILVQYAKIFFDPFYIVIIVICVTISALRCLMVVNKYNYRMCAKIIKYVKILLLEFLNEDHIINFFLLCKDFFLTNCMYCQLLLQVGGK